MRRTGEERIRIKIKASYIGLPSSSLVFPRVLFSLECCFNLFLSSLFFVFFSSFLFLSFFVFPIWLLPFTFVSSVRFLSSFLRFLFIWLLLFTFLLFLLFFEFLGSISFYLSSSVHLFFFTILQFSSLWLLPFTSVSSVHFSSFPFFDFFVFCSGVEPPLPLLFCLLCEDWLRLSSGVCPPGGYLRCPQRSWRKATL